MRRTIFGVLGSLLVATSALAQDGPGNGSENGILTTKDTGALSIRRALQTAIAAQKPTSAELLGRQPMSPVRASSATTARAAQDEAAAGPVISVSAGIDFTNAYFFRGYYQEASGFIGQPWVDTSMTVNDMVSLNFGVWNSVHSSDETGKFYELDFYAGATVSAGSLSSGAVYTAYVSPADVFDTIHELAFSLGYDDSDSVFPLAPSVLFAFDLDNPYHYWEIAVEPAIPMEDSPVSLTVPVTVGMSLNEYYDESAFGFFSVGLNGTYPVTSNAELWGGVQLLALGDGPKGVNLDDDGNPQGSKVIIAVGLSVSY